MNFNHLEIRTVFEYLCATDKCLKAVAHPGQLCSVSGEIL